MTSRKVTRIKVNKDGFYLIEYLCGRLKVLKMGRQKYQEFLQQDITYQLQLLIYQIHQYKNTLKNL